MLTYGFHNSVAGDRKYNASQISSIFDGIIEDGVFASIGDTLAVSSVSGMDVTVGIGRAWFNHTWTNNDALLPLTVEPSEVALNRIDVVVLEINSDNAVRANSIKIVKGVPGSNPVAPAMTRTTYVNQYPLAHIYVGAGVASITQANITNKVGTSECPFVTGVLETVNIDNLLTQWDAQFDEWFANVKDQLSTDAAGNLQLQIDDLYTTKLGVGDAETPAGAQAKVDLHADTKLITGVHGFISIANITYYVNTATGNDTNDGLTSGTAFKTVQKAIDSLPIIINHTVTINVANGNYNETVTISGFYGKGSIFLYGDTVTSTNCSINNIIGSRSTITLTVRGINITTTTAIGINCNTLFNAIINNCNVVSNALGWAGIQFSRGGGSVNSCVISNRNYGIVSSGAKVTSNTNTGNGNVYGLYVTEGGELVKTGTQPSGTTANEYITTGGNLRGDNVPIWRMNNGIPEWSSDNGATWNGVSSSSPVGSFEYGFPLL